MAGYNPKMKTPAVYIMTNKPNGTLYTGVTTNLMARVWQHKSGEGGNKFTEKYNLNRLVYFELCVDLPVAIAREKQIKKWRRAWKVELIEGDNPGWRDLWSDIV